MIKKHRAAVVTGAALIGGALAGAACAEDAPKPAGPGLADVLAASGITEAGYVAASYYRSNGYSTYHQFDVQHDTFQLDQAAVTLAYQPKEGFGALVNLAAGEDMRILHQAEDGHDQTFDAVQAFVQYASGPLTVIAGKYVTLAGAEVIDPTGNANFSRSLLFTWAIPLDHTGVRATYAVSDTLNLIVGANNGWNTTSTSYGSKTAELGATWAPSKALSVAATSYIGKEPAFDAQRAILDLVATYKVTDSLSLVLNYDWGKQEQHTAGAPDLKWTGIAGYVNYALNDQWRVSLRAEYLDDKDGYIAGTPQKLKEATLTFGFDPVKSFELRFEARYDKSDRSTFIRALPQAETSASLADSQTGVVLQGIYKF